MKLHIIRSGDLIKPLPIPTKDGKFVMKMSVRYVYADTSLIYDKNDFLMRLYQKERKTKGTLNIRSTPITTRHFICVTINNEIKFLSLGRSLNIMLNDYICDVNSKGHISVDIKHSKQGYLIFDGSREIAIRGHEPLVDSTELQDWADYVRENQDSYLEDYITKRNLSSQESELEKIYWPGCLNELIQDDRNSKLGNILNI